jgi:N-acetylglucosaminyldiphosphoundecaprenol N-acetyl-beta-D-mannosaminyltransferase
MRVTFLETPMDVLSLEETVQRAAGSMREGKRVSHVALNVAKLVKMRSDLSLRADVTSSDIIGIDGAGIVFGARLLGVSVSERVAGIDLMEALLNLCAKEGFRPFFLGATKEVVSKAAAAAEERYPGLRFAGLRDGYFSSSDEPAIIDEINRSGAHCLFIGMPTPHKENFLAVQASRLQTPFLMGVGGSFDVLAGQVSRAPLVLQKIGLEWMHRLMQEPRRMFWRYASTNATFIALLWREIFGRFTKTTGFTSTNKVRGH